MAELFCWHLADDRGRGPVQGVGVGAGEGGADNHLAGLIHYQLSSPGDPFPGYSGGHILQADLHRPALDALFNSLGLGKSPCGQLRVGRGHPWPAPSRARAGTGRPSSASTAVRAWYLAM